MDITDIIAYLNGHSTEEQKAQLEDWLSERAENKALFAKTKVLWKESQQKSVSNPNVEQAWQKVGQQTVHKKAKTIFLLAKVAAVFLVLLSAFALWNYFQAPIWNRYQQDSFAQRKPLLLDDGTKVWLNANTTLSYPENFEGKKRQVKLSGEAYFEVARDTNRPFMIDAGKTAIKVLGTSFNVRAHPDSLNNLVFVETGKVAFYPKGKEASALILEKNQGGIYNRNKQQLEQFELKTPNHLAWKTKRLVFDQTALREVVLDIKNVYGQQVIFDNPDLAQCKLTAVFDNEPVGNIYETLEILFDINIQKENNRITLSGTACNSK